MLRILDHSNANARKVFLCSLWYLPFLLAAYVFHSRNWQWEGNKLQGQVDSEEDRVKIANAVLAAKEVGKGFCVHEVLANKSIDEGSDNPLCPPVMVKEIKEGKVEVGNGSNKDSSIASCSGGGSISSAAVIDTEISQHKK